MPFQFLGHGRPTPGRQAWSAARRAASSIRYTVPHRGYGVRVLDREQTAFPANIRNPQSAPRLKTRDSALHAVPRMTDVIRTRETLDDIHIYDKHQTHYCVACR